MHSENFYDHEMRTLTPKLFLQEMLRRETKSNGSDTKIDSALSHNLKGEVSREDCKRIMLHSDKISFPTNIAD